MPNKHFYTHLHNEIKNIKNNGLYKSERIITSAQQSNIEVHGEHQVLNFCANNYLGLANSPQLILSAQKALDDYGFGMASVRFICGTQHIHKNLENHLSHFLQMEDTILYSSCFDANTGLFETLLNKDDAIISDELNHASIIDGIRLCKAQRYRYKNNHMEDLERCLKEAGKNGARFKMIATDGVFSMDGVLANLPEICDLAEKYQALVMVDDSHAVGLLGQHGRGTHEFHAVMDRIDILTGTLGKALGGASGGYTSGKKEIIELLRQRSRPYLFSNTLTPAIAQASIQALTMIQESQDLRENLHTNAQYFRKGMTEAGFQLTGADHPIVPVMIGDAERASIMADTLLSKQIYVVAFSYPVVPKNKARIRVQLSAAHSKEQIDKAVDAFVHIGKELGVIE
jgi:glycine C-acetyltransferase